MAHRNRQHAKKPCFDFAVNLAGRHHRHTVACGQQRLHHDRAVDPKACDGWAEAFRLERLIEGRLRRRARQRHDPRDAIEILQTFQALRGQRMVAPRHHCQAILEQRLLLHVGTGYRVAQGADDDVDFRKAQLVQQGFVSPVDHGHLQTRMA